MSPNAMLQRPALTSAISGVLYSGLRNAISNSGIDSRGRPLLQRYQPQLWRISEFCGASDSARWKFCSAFGFSPSIA